MPTAINHNLDQLLVLEAIHKEGTFGAAARTLHRVPSAISYVVRGLEEALGVPVFDRSGKRAALTPEGRRVLEEGRKVLRAARSLEQLAEELRSGWESDLHVVVDGIFPMGPITRVLRAFTEREIPTRIRLDVEYRYGVPDRFEADKAQLMLILDFQDAEAALDGTPLGALELVLVASPEHPLAGSDAWSDGLAETCLELVVRDSSPRLAQTAPRSFTGSQHIVCLSDFHSKRLALLEGVGFGWIPSHLVEADLESGALVRLQRPEGSSWTYHPRLVHRTTEPLGRGARLFVDLLREETVQKT